MMVICFVTNGLYAQSIACSGGGNVTNGNAEISYTIGTIDYVSLESSEYNITGGIQQPFEWFTTNVTIFASHELKIYPNPASEILNLESKNNQSISIEIHNLLGELCLSKSITFGRNTIDISHLKQGIYLIHFNQAIYKSIKFIKS
jgi:hypothetical protein